MEKSSESSQSNDIFHYLERLDKSSLLRIYEDQRGEWAAKTTLQKLPELARQFVIRLSICGGSFPYEHITSWSSSSSKRDVRDALTRMEALGMVDPYKSQNRDEFGDGNIDNFMDALDINPKYMVSLTKQYNNAIQASLTSLASSPYHAITIAEYEQLCAKEKLQVNEGKAAKYPNTIPTPKELETYTQTRWDSVLHFLVGTDDKDYEDPPSAIISFLEETGLMQEDPDWRSGGREQIAPLVITSKGYEFMLQEVHVQVWQFILKYIQRLEGQENSEELRREALLFLICLSYCKVGRGYRAGELSKPMRNIMKDLALFGLLYVCKIGKVTLFFPTRVAVNLVVGGLADSTISSISASESTSLSALSTSAAATKALEVELESATPSKNHIALIVQTNFQVAAYTTSSLHMTMLSLFCDINSLRRLPNVIFFRITRDSVKSAFRLGIEANQILRWMKMHAHPRLRTGDQPLIPSNVEDQIILWDRERTRVIMQEVFMLQCDGEKEFDVVRQYAIDHDAFEWGCETRRQILIQYGKAEFVVAFTRRWRARAAKRQEAIDSGAAF